MIDLANLPEGASARVQHFRYVAHGLPVRALMPAYVIRDLGGEPAGRGGLTWVRVRLADGATMTATALCNESDNFDRRRGRTIALARALRELRVGPRGPH